MKADILSNPAMVCKMAGNAAKLLVDLHYSVGVVGFDHNADIPTVQMADLNSLRYITGGVKLKMEREEMYTRYSVMVDGVEYFFLSPKKQEEQFEIEH